MWKALDNYFSKSNHCSKKKLKKLIVIIVIEIWLVMSILPYNIEVVFVILITCSGDIQHQLVYVYAWFACHHLISHIPNARYPPSSFLQVSDFFGILYFHRRKIIFSSLVWQCNMRKLSFFVKISLFLSDCYLNPLLNFIYINLTYQFSLSA